MVTTSSYFKHNKKVIIFDTWFWLAMTEKNESSYYNDVQVFFKDACDRDKKLILPYSTIYELLRPSNINNGNAVALFKDIINKLQKGKNYYLMPDILNELDGKIYENTNRFCSKISPKWAREKKCSKCFPSLTDLQIANVIENYPMDFVFATGNSIDFNGIKTKSKDSWVIDFVKKCNFQFTSK